MCSCGNWCPYESTVLQQNENNKNEIQQELYVKSSKVAVLKWATLKNLFTFIFGFDW